MGAGIRLFLGWEMGFDALGLGFSNWEWETESPKWEWDSFSPLINNMKDINSSETKVGKRSFILFRVTKSVELGLSLFCLQPCAESQKLHHPRSLSISFPEPARLLNSGMCLNVTCSVNIAASAWKWDFSKIHHWDWDFAKIWTGKWD